MRRLDETDLRILHLLQANPRSPVSHVARQVKLTDNAVRYRIRRLQQAGVIREFVMVVDPRYLGRPTLHLALLHLSDPGQLGPLLRSCADAHGAYLCEGAFNAVVLVSCAEGQLAALVERLRAAPGVEQAVLLTVTEALRGAPMPMAPAPMGLERSAAAP